MAALSRLTGEPVFEVRMKSENLGRDTPWDEVTLPEYLYHEVFVLWPSLL
jgi:hypothetical protein